MRKALIIGINIYNNRSDRLKGCLNDAEKMSNIFDNSDFSIESTRSLLNSIATKEVIINNLINDIDSCRPNDCFIFYFSGHGSQVESNEPGIENDYLDEVLCPTDFSIQEGKFIRDKELVEIFGRGLSRGVNIEIILDSCFSGGMDRGGLGIKVFQELKNKFSFLYSKDRCIQSSYDISGKNVNKFELNFLNSKSTNVVNFVLWSACKGDQRAKEEEIGGVIQGVFTYHFSSCIKDSITRSELHSEIQNRMPRYKQIPQIVSPVSLKNLPIFQF
jgi:hypothetical protein